MMKKTFIFKIFYKKYINKCFLLLLATVFPIHPTHTKKFDNFTMMPDYIIQYGSELVNL